ncbi:hypothetical protein [Shewanella maritima]|uniref:hypothetical protein n=1 Tax=Shewanella maritima TaxID=2520507 RepID=UPI0013EE4DBD|nr:hypothetical protein [Shewanella maritima]
MAKRDKHKRYDEDEWGENLNDNSKSKKLKNKRRQQKRVLSEDDTYLLEQDWSQS